MDFIKFVDILFEIAKFKSVMIKNSKELQKSEFFKTYLIQQIFP